MRRWLVSHLGSLVSGRSCEKHQTEGASIQGFLVGLQRCRASRAELTARVLDVKF